mgnify:CR=1 FL=1
MDFGINPDVDEDALPKGSKNDRWLLEKLEE